MCRIGNVLVLLAVLALGTHAARAAPSDGTPNVRGQLMRGPLRPVSRDVEPNQVPARGVAIAFYRDGSLVTSVVTGRNGRFSLTLRPGGYAIRTVKKAPFGILTPRTFRVLDGKQTVLHLNLHLETGIRAPGPPTLRT